MAVEIKSKENFKIIMSIILMGLSFAFSYLLSISLKLLGGLVVDPFGIFTTIMAFWILLLCLNAIRAIIS